MMILGVKLGPWTWSKGRTRGYAYVVFMAKPKSRMRIFSVPALPTLSVICCSALLGLAFLSMLVSRLLDLDHLSANSGPPIQLRRENVYPMLALSQDLQEVPSQGDLSSGNIWESKSAQFYYGCSEPGKSYSSALFSFKSSGYLMIEASGGLNQQRTGITDAVVVARLLNATLVVPNLDHKSYWKDSSNFSDIFDVDWFIKALASDVPILKALPASAKSAVKHSNTMRVPRKCTAQYYQSRIMPILQKKQVLRLTKFDYRLANKLDPELQKLRCRVNYNALQFTPPILEMGRSIVKRMRQMTSRYIALHLRFEPDMLAFSGCYYGGGEKEIKELGAIRKRWKTLHVRSPERERRNGKCPLTPQEVGLMLRSLGFGNDSYLYVASGEVYGGEASLAPLKALFPNYFTKETLASKEELQPFLQFSSRMAALDYIVCDESNVFVTNNNGNMARILAGRRRYYGHKKTIRPNTKKLGSLFLARHEMSWDDFASKVRIFQKGFLGEPNEGKPGRGEFHENPTSCICERHDPSHRQWNGLPEHGYADDMRSSLEQELDDPFNSYDIDIDKDIKDESEQQLLESSSNPHAAAAAGEGEAEEFLPLFSD